MQLLRSDMPGAATTPHADGWYALKWPDRTISVQQYKGGQWQWGSGSGSNLSLPGKPSALAWLGNDVNSTDFWRRADMVPSAFSETAAQNIGLIHQFDVGWFQKGKAFAIDANGNPVGGTPANSSFGDVNPINQIPSPLSPSTGNTGGGLLGGNIFGAFATVGFWKGLGLVIAGALILVFAALEFKSMTGVTVPVPRPRV